MLQKPGIRLSVHTYTNVHTLTHAPTLSLTFEVHNVEITTETEQAPSQLSQPTPANGKEDDDGDEEPSVLQALSSEQLARRASFKWVAEVTLE